MKIPTQLMTGRRLQMLAVDIALPQRGLGNRLASIAVASCLAVIQSGCVTDCNGARWQTGDEFHQAASANMQLNYYRDYLQSLGATPCVGESELLIKRVGSWGPPPPNIKR